MKIEKMTKKKENKVTLGMVIKYFLKKSKPYKRLLLLSLFGSIIVAGVSILMPIYQTKLVDIVAMTGVARSELVLMLLKILRIILLLDIINFGARRMIGFPQIKYESEVTKDIYQECFEYLHRHSYKFFSNNLTGSLINKINKLAGAYVNVVDMFIYQILNIIIFIPMTIIIVMKQNITVGFMFLAFVIVYSTLQVLFFQIMKKYEIESNKKNSEMTGELSDSVINNFNILTFASLPYEIKRFGKTLFGWTKVRYKQWSIMEWTWCGCSIVTGIFCIGSVYFAIKARGAGLISASVIILVEMYVVRISEQLSNIRFILKSLSRTLGESTEMLEILNTPHEIQDHSDKKLKITSGRVDFEDVTFKYDDGKAIFDGLNLSIKPGEKIAIVGASGSGKTTFVKLLFRFFDIDGGKILVDGQDISQITQDSLRGQLSMVPQDPILFHRTIKENIAYGKTDATDEEIIAAAKMAKCHEFITNLKDGYDSYVGERGIKLSGGERQRIAIARAILENKRILVMDEATSSLDSESEKFIQDAMDEVMKNKTCIVIAHRLSTIAKMDKIIVMDDGKIVEKGSHKQLLQKKDGIYNKLRNIQSGGFLQME